MIEINNFSNDITSNIFIAEKDYDLVIIQIDTNCFRITRNKKNITVASPRTVGGEFINSDQTNYLLNSQPNTIVSFLNGNIVDNR